MTRMLQERNVLDASFVAMEGVDPDLIRPWEAAGELVRRLDDSDEDVFDEIENYRELFETLLAERRPP
jgi:hypothetical protein